MTVSRHKRRVSTSRALGAAIVGFALALVLGVVGGLAIFNTEDGQVLGNDVPEDSFPETPVGALAVQGDDGTLASLVVFAVRPDGNGGSYDPRGGTIVPLPVNADLSGGFGDERRPLDASDQPLDASGIDRSVSNLIGVSIDAAIVVTEDALAELLAGLGPVAVELPAAVTNDGEEVAPAGAQTLDGTQLAAVLAAIDSDESATDRYPIDVAVWRGIGTALGDGASPIALVDTPAVPDASEPSAASLNEPGVLLRWLSSGKVGVTRLRADAVTDLAANPDEVDTVTLDRAEVVTLFGHIAPSRVAAPNPGPNFLVRSGYGDDQLVGGLSRYDVAYAATGALLVAEANVLSVDSAPGDAGEATVVEVADKSMVDGVQSLSEIFGPIEVTVAKRRVIGISVVVTLGTDYLANVEAASAPNSTAPPPDTSGTDEGDE